MTEIVAEISGNHGGNLENALLLIRMAKAAGADTVKFQCFEPMTLAVKRAANKYVGELAAGRDLVDLYRQIHTPKEWFPELIRQTKKVGIWWFSSVFDPADVAFLETMECPRYKISAFEMLDGDLINAVRATGKPIIISVRPADGVTVLLADRYDDKPVFYGISDHRNNGFAHHSCPMVEKHLRLDYVDTPDKDFSLTPSEFQKYVATIRRILK